MDELQRIPLDAIVVRDRLRAVDEGYVALLASSLATVGLQNPIQVGPADAAGCFPLVAGGLAVIPRRMLPLLDLAEAHEEAEAARRRVDALRRLAREGIR